MQLSQFLPTTRESVHYTARHRHHLPGGGYTEWSEGVPNGRHSHGVPGDESAGFVADSVGSPVHRHAWCFHRRLRNEQGYTSGPLVARPVIPPLAWLQRALSR